MTCAMTMSLLEHSYSVLTGKGIWRGNAQEKLQCSHRPCVSITVTLHHDIKHKRSIANTTQQPRITPSLRDIIPIINHFPLHQQPQQSRLATQPPTAPSDSHQPRNKTRITSPTPKELATRPAMMMLAAAALWLCGLLVTPRASSG